MTRTSLLVAASLCAFACPASAQVHAYDSLIAKHAAANGVPESLVRKIIMHESRYQAGVVGGGGATGLMQIKYSTARGMGYRGTLEGLKDPDTNLTWAVRYLGGAYRAARGNQAVAFSYYGKGFRYSGPNTPSPASERVALATPAATSVLETPVTPRVTRHYSHRTTYRSWRHARHASNPFTSLAATFKAKPYTRSGRRWARAHRG